MAALHGSIRPACCATASCAPCSALLHKGLKPGGALADLLQIALPLLYVVRQAVAPGLVVGAVRLGELNHGHVLLQSPHHRQLEEGLCKELHLVADLRADKTVGLQHQLLHLLHDHVHLVLVRRDLLQPLGEHQFYVRAILDLLGHARLHVVERRGRQGAGVGWVLELPPLEEDPGVGELGGEHVVEELRELLELPLARLVVHVEDALLDHLVLLDELHALGEELGVHVGGGRALQLLHELQDRLLLDHEEPLDALPDVLDPALQRDVSLVTQQLHDHVAPCDGAHGHAAGLDHVALAHVLGDVGEAQEDLHLGDHAPVHGPAVDLDVKGTHLDLAPQVVDVVVERGEVVRGQHAEVRGAHGLVVGMELAQLLLERHDRLQVQHALHDVREGRGEGHAAVAGGAQDPVWVRLAELRLQLLLAPLHGLLEVPELVEHWPHGVREHHLDLPLHVGGEVREADGLHVPGAEALGLHLPQVLGVHALAQLAEGLGGRGAVPPPGERQGEADEVLRQVAVAVHPPAHVVVGQVVVELVQLVADEDGALKLGVDLAALLQRRHRRCVRGLLHAQHDVPLVLHESHDELDYLVGQVLLRGVEREVAEARQVHDLHVHAEGRLHPHPDGLGAHRLAELLMRGPD
mmetsp:Transcript_93812/g.289332  ORF Transcript_93812/g.289332 Transcript_93812/m.289332 type:complete len:636 (-) Transcript_93812:385-2292(-)